MSPVVDANQFRPSVLYAELYVVPEPPFARKTPSCGDHAVVPQLADGSAVFSDVVDAYQFLPSGLQAEFLVPLNPVATKSPS